MEARYKNLLIVLVLFLLLGLIIQKTKFVQLGGMSPGVFTQLDSNEPYFGYTGYTEDSYLMTPEYPEYPVYPAYGYY